VFVKGVGSYSVSITNIDRKNPADEYFFQMKG